MVTSFCNDLTSDTLKAYNCDPTLKTMAILSNTDKTLCVKLSGEDPTKNADFNIQDTADNNGLYINYTGG